MLPAVDQDELEPEDGRNYRPKQDELIGIINKIIIVASSWLFILLHFTYLIKTISYMKLSNDRSIAFWIVQVHCLQTLQNLLTHCQI